MFFSSQSLLTCLENQGARAYYFRTVFHDWPDPSCKLALKNTVAAMERGYSRILINDQVLPEKGASTLRAAVDLTMMTMCGKERTRRDWDELLGSVGLCITRIWPVAEANQSLIEVDFCRN